MADLVSYLVFDVEAVADGALIAQAKFGDEELSPGEAIARFGAERLEPVSYTHLTLPTILLV